MNILSTFLKLLASVFCAVVLTGCNYSFKESIAKRSDSGTDTQDHKKLCCTEVLLNTVKNLRFLNPCHKYSKDKKMDREFQEYSHLAKKSLEKDRSKQIIKEAEYDFQRRTSELKTTSREKSRHQNSHEMRIEERITIPITANTKAPSRIKKN